MNFIKWAKPDDSTLELARLGGVAYINDRLSNPMLRGQGCYRLECLHQKRLVSSSKYDEGPTPQSVASTDVDPNLESEPSVDSQTRDHDGANTMASSPPP